MTCWEKNCKKTRKYSWKEEEEGQKERQEEQDEREGGDKEEQEEERKGKDRKKRKGNEEHNRHDKNMTQAAKLRQLVWKLYKNTNDPKQDKGKNPHVAGKRRKI